MGYIFESFEIKLISYLLKIADELCIWKLWIKVHQLSTEDSLMSYIFETFQLKCISYLPKIADEPHKLYIRKQL